MNNFPIISGFGVGLPTRIVSNEEISTFVDTNPEWIKSRTGIESRRFVADTELCVDLATKAALDAIQNSGLCAEQITHIIYATCTPDVECPSSACLLAHRLGIKGQVCFDVNSACTGFLSALDVARGYAALDPSACVLLVAAETLSRRCNWQDRTTSILFGDGAGATIITGAKFTLPKQAKISAKVMDNLLSSDGSLGELLVIGGGLSHPPYKMGDSIGAEYFLTMQGREVFKHAVRCMTSVAGELLKRNGLEIGDIDLLIPHQANLRIIEAVGSRLEIPESKTFVNVNKYGNTSAASIPIALGEALEQNKILAGQKVLLVSFGGGFTWGSALLQF